MKPDNRIEAFWILPDDQIISVHRTHIQTVIDNPQLFSLSSDYIVSKYAMENEELGVEGRAREQIILELLKDNYIRIRYYPRKSSWTINLNELSMKSVRILQKWSEFIIGQGFSKYDLLNIDMPKGKLMLPIEDLIKSEINPLEM